MFVIKNIFQAKPGKAKELVAKFKAAEPHFKALGILNLRIMTDTVANYWTVVTEATVNEISDYFNQDQQRAESAKIGEAMKGYMDLVSHGHREIFKVE